MDKGTLQLILSILEVNQLTNKEIKKWLLAKPMHETNLDKMKQLLSDNEKLLELLREKLN